MGAADRGRVGREGAKTNAKRPGAREAREVARGVDKRGDRRKGAIVLEPAHRRYYFFRSLVTAFPTIRFGYFPVNTDYTSGPHYECTGGIEARGGCGGRQPPTVVPNQRRRRKFSGLR